MSEREGERFDSCKYTLTGKKEKKKTMFFLCLKSVLWCVCVCLCVCVCVCSTRGPGVCLPADLPPASLFAPRL